MEIKTDMAKTKLVAMGIKLGATSVTSIGVGLMVLRGVELLAPKDMKPLTKFCVNFTGAIVGVILGDVVGRYVCKQVDDVVSVVNLAKELKNEVIKNAGEGSEV